MRVQGIGFSVQDSDVAIANCQLQIAKCKLQNMFSRETKTSALVDSGQWTAGSGRCETASGFVHPSSLILHPLRSGISLLEVLFAIGVLALGLLGVAAILPLGQFALWETAKADRSGACGRAALREIQVRRMLDYRFWSMPATYTDPTPFAIDPLGVWLNNVSPGTLGPMARCSFTWITTLAQAEKLFFWSDDLPFSEAKNSGERPRLITTTDPNTGNPIMVSEGAYSWFFTVMPATTEMSLPVAQRRLFNVSIVVCYKRNFSTGTTEGEHTATITANTPTMINGFPGMGLGGGTVRLDLGSNVNVKENQWVMLHHLHVDPTTGVPLPGYPILNRCHWYRVLGVGGTTNTISLNGPDWDPNLSATLVVVPGAIGVYNTTLELDWDPLWTR